MYNKIWMRLDIYMFPHIHVSSNFTFVHLLIKIYKCTNTMYHCIINTWTCIRGWTGFLHIHVYSLILLMIWMNKTYVSHVLAFSYYPLCILHIATTASGVLNIKRISIFLNKIQTNMSHLLHRLSSAATLVHPLFTSSTFPYATHSFITQT